MYSRNISAIIAIVIAVVTASCAKEAGQEERAAASAVNAPVPVTSEPRNPNLPTELAKAIREQEFVSAKSCNIETLDGARPGTEQAVVKTTNVKMTGWLVGVDGLSTLNPAVRVDQLGVGRAWSLALELSSQRKDVASQFGVPADAKVGFSRNIDVSTLPSGSYRLLLTFDGPDGAHYVCDNGRKFTLAG